MSFICHVWVACRAFEKGSAMYFTYHVQLSLVHLTCDMYFTGHNARSLLSTTPPSCSGARLLF
jgi:hypothetical protein